ncbi:uncharacterized protein [Typha angustifolia]|uniref:uncharacterized protein n=1 Tax=Typha angustifolia TaxID=59011 RepID=UPI003C305A8F
MAVVNSNSLLFFPTTTVTSKSPSSFLLLSHKNKIKTSLRPLKPVAATAARFQEAGQLSSSLNPRRLKSRLAAGETLYGFSLLSSSPTFAEIAGLAGYDYVLIDMEHGPGGISDALPCLRALAATQTPVVIRLPESTSTWAKKALDLGPDGLMFPGIESPRAAQLAVSYCRFPPRGVRGNAYSIVRASGYGIDDGYLARCEEDLLVMCQVETPSGLAQVEEISAVEGVDVVQMGPLDLSASMGYLLDPGNRKVREVVRETERRVFAVRQAAKGIRGPYLGGFGKPHDDAEQLKLRGYHMVIGASDVGMFRKAAVEDVRRFRSVKPKIGVRAGELN